MKRLTAAALAVLFVLSASTGLVLSDEGMWMPNDLHNKKFYAHLAERGLKLSAADIWNPKAPSLSDAMIMVGRAGKGGPTTPIQGFGSASFISDKGLIITNHHVAYDSLAALATPEHNYVETGYIAREMKDEKPCSGMAIQITTNIEDVTARIFADVKEGMSPSERAATLAKARRAIIEENRKAGKTCDVKDMLFGYRYYLFTFDVIRDVRMVYAPPAAIGEFGGDIDNWMWPRHSGDFTYLRAYVGPNGERRAYADDNVPYRPKKWLKVSVAGYKPGDFCFIMGHPGTTWRYRTSNSVSFWEDINFPGQVRALEQMKAQMEANAGDDEAKKLAIASQLKSINNTLKNFTGQIEGLKRLHIVDRRRTAEKALQDWIDADSNRRKKYGDIFKKLEDLYARLRSGGRQDRDFMQSFGPTVTELRYRLIHALAEYKKSLLYADANMTLRFTYGSIRGYSPKDGVDYRYYTTIEGVVAKHTGETPFAVPEKERRLVTAKDYGPWADKRLGTVPVCFLSDTDITGGNSGSPIMNGRGELIGLAFDGNYEAMTSDFTFDDSITRTINVDIRYVLWCTDKIAGLRRILDEIEIVGAGN